MKTKMITVRCPVALHTALMDYCELRFVSASSLILQLVCKEIGYKHVKPAYRTPYVEPHEEEEEIREFTEEEYADLLRRVDAAPPADVKC